MQSSATPMIRGARADLLAERLLAQTVATVAAARLADPSDLLELTDHGELVDPDTGLPDPDLIEAAAAQLVERKPHLARRGGPAAESTKERAPRRLPRSTLPASCGQRPHVFWRIVGFVIDAGKAARSWIVTGVVVLFIGLLIFGWIAVIRDTLWAAWSLPAVVGVAWLFYILGGQED